jgi:hypothetical protein
VQIGRNAAVTEESAAASPEMARPHTGSFSFNGATGEVANRGTVSVSSSELLGGAGSGILGTARTPWGSPTSDLKPTTLVDVDGSGPTELRVAEKMGYVRRDENGRYVEVAQAERVATEQQQQQERQGTEEQQEAFAPEDEAAIIEMVQGVEPQMLGSAVTSLAIELADTGTLGKDTLEKVVSQTGMEPVKAAAFIEKTFNLFTQQASAELQKSGIDSEHFLRWARQNRPEELKRAFVDHVQARSLSAYRTLAQTFLRSTPPSADALSRAGFDTRIDPTSNELLVKIGDSWHSVREATRNGLLYKGAA